MPGLGTTGLLTRCEWLEAVLTMLSQLPELQPAISSPSSFLGISWAAAASGAGGKIPAEAEKGKGVKLRDPLLRWKHAGSARGRTRWP